jgi:hypothetical protein
MKVALVALPIICLIPASTALAVGAFGGENSLNPTQGQAAKIGGIEQLVATYVADFDEGPIGEQGTFDPNAIGNLFTPHGNWAIMYWNAGHPKELTWTSADGPGPDYSACNNIGPAAISRAVGGPATRPLTTTDVHHNINDIQVQLDRGGQTATVRGEMDIFSGQPNKTLNGGTETEIWSGHYFGHVLLTSQGWKFTLWEPIVDQPTNLGSDCAVNNGS